MKKSICAAMIVTLLLAAASAAGADGYVIPDNRSGYSGSYSGGGYSGITVQLTDDLATRSGPSTSYTGCGSYRMKGSWVTALSKAYDNGGVLWVEIEFSYGGGYRRAWTGAKRLNISSRQLASLPDANSGSFIGYGTISRTTAPRFGPGTLYASYGDRDLYPGNQVAMLRYENGYYLVECYHTDGHILRSWIPESSVN